MQFTRKYTYTQANMRIYYIYNQTSDLGKCLKWKLVHVFTFDPLYAVTVQLLQIFTVKLR